MKGADATGPGHPQRAGARSKGQAASPSREAAAGRARDGAGQVTLDVTLHGREYRIACAEAERGELEAAVALLDGRMAEIRDAGKVGGSERIAVMAALNLAHDLLRAERAAAEGAPIPAATDAHLSFAIDDAGVRRRILSMRASIEEVLGGQDKLF